MTRQGDPRKRLLQGLPRPYARTSGGLLACVLLPFGIWEWSRGVLVLDPGSWQTWVAGLSSAALLAAGLTLPRHPRSGRLLSTAALLGCLLLGLEGILVSPAAALGALVAGGALMATLWTAGGLPFGPRLRRQRLLEYQAHGAALACLGLWTWTLLAAASSPVRPLVVAAAFAATTLLALRWVLGEGRRHRVRTLILGSALLASMAGGLLAPGGPDRGTVWAALLALAVVLVLPRAEPASMGRGGWWELLSGRPERLLVGTFLGLSLVGAMVLALPQCSETGAGIGLLDAGFTAVSAVCVTGLIVRDTATELSVQGQAVVLALIQLGGLGIMSFSTLALRVLGRRPSLRYEGVVASLLSTQDRSRIFDAATRILVVTVVAETAGAVILGVFFLMEGDPLGQAAWRGIFTAVSAFCNAGFALQTHSLVPYGSSPQILHVVALLVIAGGLSPAVVLAVPGVLRRRTRAGLLQAKVALTMTAGLLVSAFLLVLAFEWDHGLSGYSVGERLHHAWFQAVTLRTAGFNSMDIAAVRPATLTVMMIWMFIGGCPGGTAGGIKTTTVWVLILTVVSTLRGHTTVSALGRRLEEGLVRRALLVAFLGFMTLLVLVFAMLLTQAMSPRLALFEAVSAMGTVGLSLGGTAALDGVGKLIIMVGMFTGRVGPLAVMMYAGGRKIGAVVDRPKGDMELG